jgi:hypothetical protein
VVDHLPELVIRWRWKPYHSVLRTEEQPIQPKALQRNLLGTQLPLDPVEEAQALWVPWFRQKRQQVGESTDRHKWWRRSRQNSNWRFNRTGWHRKWKPQQQVQSVREDWKQLPSQQQVRSLLQHAQVLLSTRQRSLRSAASYVPH